MLPVLFRDLATGKAGKAMLGGPLEGLEGRGSAVAMFACGWQRSSSEKRSKASGNGG